MKKKFLSPIPETVVRLWCLKTIANGSCVERPSYSLVMVSHLASWSEKILSIQVLLFFHIRNILYLTMIFRRGCRSEGSWLSTVHQQYTHTKAWGVRRCATGHGRAVAGTLRCPSHASLPRLELLDVNFIVRTSDSVCVFGVLLKNRFLAFVQCKVVQHEEDHHAKNEHHSALTYPMLWGVIKVTRNGLYYESSGKKRI